MMDRVPVFLEIDAKMIPYPAKIIMRPNIKKYGYSETAQKIIESNMTIFCSTQTKNPNIRNNQFMMRPPDVKRVFQFAPLQNTTPKDTFENKIYIAISYDLQEAGVDTEDIQQIHMQICVSFPKDKEEMEKQRMAAMFKKLGGGGGVMQDGEQRMKEINNDLTQFMKDNKEERKPSPSMTTRTKLEKDDGYTVQNGQG